MPAIRSAILGRGTVNAGQHLQLYAPPSGQVALVKTIYGFARFAEATTIAVTLKDQAGIDLHLFIDSVQPNNPFKWEGWVVLEFGTYLECSCVAGPVQVWTSGAILPDAYAP